MELHQLRYFVAVAEAGSFSRAAEHCHVSQPSLSQQIKKLERDLGHQLFDRQAHGTVMTEAGQALLPRARRILLEVQEAKVALPRDLEAGRVPLAVGAIPTMAPYLLPPVLAQFLGTYPECELTVCEDFTERVVEAIANFELDCAIVSTPIEHPLVEVEVLGSERLLLTAARNYPLPPTERLTFENLRGEKAIVLHEMHCLGQQIRDFCVAQRVNQRILCRSSQLATVERLVASGLGISIVPEMAARIDESETLRYLPLKKAQPRREIAVVWRRYRTRSQLAERFVELLREDLASGLHTLESTF